MNQDQFQRLLGNDVVGAEEDGGGSSPLPLLLFAGVVGYLFWDNAKRTKPRAAVSGDEGSRTRKAWAVYGGKVNPRVHYFDTEAEAASYSSRHNYTPPYRSHGDDE